MTPTGINNGNFRNGDYSYFAGEGLPKKECTVCGETRYTYGLYNVCTECSMKTADLTALTYGDHDLQPEAEQQAAEVRNYSAWLTAEPEDKLTDKVSKMLKNFDVPNQVIISGGEVLEVEPYRPASDNDDMPF